MYNKPGAAVQFSQIDKHRSLDPNLFLHKANVDGKNDKDTYETKDDIWNICLSLLPVKLNQ